MSMSFVLAPWVFLSHHMLHPTPSIGTYFLVTVIWAVTSSGVSYAKKSE